MNKFIKYFNQNRREIFVIIIIILLAFFLLKFINFSISKRKEKEIQESNLNIKQNNIIKNDDNINTYQVITGGKSNSTAKKQTDYIVEFIKYCNEANIEAAYQMLSDDCKAVMFPSLEYFKQIYYNNNFKTNKSYSIQNWANSIYKVDLKENMLHTGKTNMNNIQDFITVIKDENEYKLNINNFIEKTELNKKNISENLSVEIISKNTFMSYEIYKVKVKNNNDFTVYLDDLTKTDNIYITDEKDNKYVSYAHELTKEQLRVNPHSSIELDIKFTNTYIVSRKIEKMTFSNVVLDKEQEEKINIVINLK